MATTATAEVPGGRSKVEPSVTRAPETFSEAKVLTFDGTSTFSVTKYVAVSPLSAVTLTESVLVPSTNPVLPVTWTEDV